MVVVNTCWYGDTVSFSTVIDRASVSPAIVRGLCDVWSTIKSATFVTDKQSAGSMCPPEGFTRMVSVVCVFYCHSNFVWTNLVGHAT